MQFKGRNHEISKLLNRKKLYPGSQRLQKGLTLHQVSKKPRSQLPLQEDVASCKLKSRRGTKGKNTATVGLKMREKGPKEEGYLVRQNKNPDIKKEKHQVKSIRK